MPTRIPARWSVANVATVATVATACSSAAATLPPSPNALDDAALLPFVPCSARLCFFCCSLLLSDASELFGRLAFALVALEPPGLPSSPELGRATAVVAAVAAEDEAGTAESGREARELGRGTRPGGLTPISA